VALAETIQPLLDWIHAHPHLTNLLVLLVAMSESLVVVGVIVPGAVLMLAFGALIETGGLNFWSICTWAVVGAVIGDGLSYLVGYYFRERLVRIWPFRTHPQWIDAGQAFFQRHGGKSVLLGRFVGPLRATVPAVAGMLRMSPLRFLFYTVCSALLWAPAYLMPGIAFAASLELAAQVAWRLAVLVVLLLLLLFCSAWLARAIWRQLAPRVAGWADSLADWSHRHPLLGRLSEALVDPGHRETPALLAAGSLLLGSALLLSAWPLVTVDPDQPGLQSALSSQVTSLRSPWGDRLMLLIGALGSLAAQGLVAAAVLVVLLAARVGDAARHWMAALAFGALLSATHYWLAGSGPLAGEGGLLTSPQAGLTGVSFGFLAALLAGEAEPTRRSLHYGVATVAIALVTLAALYLGAGWPADALLGGLLGVAWAAIVGVAYRRRRTHPLPVLPLETAVLTALLTFGVLYLSFGIERDLAELQQPAATRTLAAAQWWAESDEELPQERVDLAPAGSAPLALQWAGALPDIEASLRGAGWQPPRPLRLESLLGWLEPGAPLAALPLLPKAHAGSHEVLARVGPDPDPATRLVLRLWPSGFLLEDGTPLWLGALERQQAATLLAGLLAGVGSSPVPIAELDVSSLAATRARALPDGELLLLQTRAPARGPTP